MLARLLRASSADDLNQNVISLTTIGPIGERIRGAGTPVAAVGMIPGLSSPMTLLRCVRLLRSERPDVLMTWLYHADFVGLIAGMLSDVPALVWNIRCSAFDFSDRTRGFRALLRVLATASRLPAAVVYNSVAGRAAHEKYGYSPRRSLVIPNGIDTDEFCPLPAAREALRRRLAIDENAKIVGTLARYHPMKDHLNFLSAAAGVLRVRDDVHFVAAGRGVAPNAVLNEAVRALGIEGRVHLMPEQSDAAGFLAALDVAVSSSHSEEGFPNAIAEAMACGTPCVATDVGDSAAILGTTGPVVPPRDPAALAHAILGQLNCDLFQLRATGAAARARIVDEFSIQRAATRYSQFFSTLALGRAPRIDASTCVG
jgi:glycosyltransferase involved in cell wall biosynthesis